jgi:hypothetical protein
MKSFGVKSENECAATEADLLNWIVAALDYGHRVKAERPEVVKRIFAECRQPALRDAIEIVHAVVAEADGTDPTRLLGRLKPWQQSVYGWSEPKYHGEELARVLYFSDFALWIPWAFNSE